jgi:hypothetical protein
LFARLYKAAEADVGKMRQWGVLPEEQADAEETARNSTPVDTPVDTTAEPDDADVLARMAAMREPKITGQRIPAPSLSPTTGTAAAVPATTAAQAPNLEAMREEIRGMRSRIDDQAHEAAPSPMNERAEPTEAQKAAGNYKLGHVRVAGLDISVENPQGSERKGTDRNGKPWSITMQHHYGYIKGTKGKDKDHIDTFVRPGTPDDWTGNVYVVDQKNPDTGAFDEHKVMLGFDSVEGARDAYHSNYEPGWRGMRAISAVSMGELKAWLANGDTTKPFDSGMPVQPLPEASNESAGGTVGSSLGGVGGAGPVTGGGDRATGVFDGGGEGATAVPVAPAAQGPSEVQPVPLAGQPDGSLTEKTPISEQSGAVAATHRAFADAKAMLAERYNVTLSTDTNMGGERFVTASKDGRQVTQVHGTSYTEAGVQSAVDWVERNIKARETEKPATPLAAEVQALKDKSAAEQRREFEALPKEEQERIRDEDMRKFSEERRTDAMSREALAMTDPITSANADKVAFALRDYARYVGNEGGLADRGACRC